MELLLSYLHLMKTKGEVTKSELLKKSSATDAQLKGLVDKNILNVLKSGLLIACIMQVKMYQPTLNYHLLKKWPRKILLFQRSQKVSSFASWHYIEWQNACVYIKLIEKFMGKGIQVLYMLPNIALTSQIIGGSQKNFGGYIGIYHSKFSPNEKSRDLEESKNRRPKIVLGAQLCHLFLPFTNLGFIICDEEHDTLQAARPF